MDDIISGGCWNNSKNFLKFYSKGIIYYAPDEINFNRIFKWMLELLLLYNDVYTEWSKTYFLIIYIIRFKNTRASFQ